MIKKWLRGYLGLEPERDLEKFVVERVKEGIQYSFEDKPERGWYNDWKYKDNFQGYVKDKVTEEVKRLEERTIRERVKELMEEINSEETLDKIINRIKTKQLN